MAIIRESVNLTAGLGETIYTVPTGKQASVSISVSNAADTYIAVQTADLASSPVSSLAQTFSDGYFSYFSEDIGYRVTGSSDDLYHYRHEASDNWSASNDFYAESTHRFSLPLSTSFNYNTAIAEFYNNDMRWKPNGAFDSTGETNTNNCLNAYDKGAASLNTEGLSFSVNSSNYWQYQGLNGSPAAYNVTSGHFNTLTSSSGWSVRTTCGTNLHYGTSTHYIYVPLWKFSDAPSVCMWDAGDINTSASITLSRAVRFSGITPGLYIQWIQESGGYTMICTTSSTASGDDKLWIVNEGAWASAGVNGFTDTGTCTDITNAAWSDIQTDPWKIKPWVNGGGAKFTFRNNNSPYPLVYDAVAGTWDTTGYPAALAYPAEIAALEATLGDAYSLYKFGSSLNDYYIVAGDERYTLIANYASLAADSSLLNSLQNDSEKGGLTLKAGDKIIAYDKSSGGTVVQVYGYEEDA